MIRKSFKGLPVGHITITHSDAGMKVAIFTSRTALILGKNGESITLLTKKLALICGHAVQIDVKEVKNPDIHATLVGDSIGRQIERRLPYRRVIKQAIAKAGNFGFPLEGAVMASDAFFPFPDCVEIAYKAGITSVIQPGGSMRDQESVDKANELGISMVITGVRHFKH